jgi:hypothetical protein
MTGAIVRDRARAPRWRQPSVADAVTRAEKAQRRKRSPKKCDVSALRREPASRWSHAGHHRGAADDFARRPGRDYARAERIGLGLA